MIVTGMKFASLLMYIYNMKKGFLQTFCLVLVLTFFAVGSLSIACAYHHGMDGLDHRQQTTSHSTLFCSSFSKLSSQVLITSFAPAILTCDLSSSNPIKVHDVFSLLLAENHLARSPPIL